jgi:hypothetical protein
MRTLVTKSKRKKERKKERKKRRDRAGISLLFSLVWEKLIGAYQLVVANCEAISYFLLMTDWQLPAQQGT